MKPLTSANAAAFLERIESARDGELRSVTMQTPTTFTLEFSVQDKNRGYDWINVAFEIDGVTDARLVDDNKFGFVDMDEGISLLFENGSCGIALGRYSALASLSDSVMYLMGQSMKYEERPFSE